MSDPEKNADKTLGESNPEEIKEKVEEALKEALQGRLTPLPPAIKELKLEEQFKIAPSPESLAPQSLVPFFWRQWANIFYGVLVAPSQTMSILCDSTLFPPNRANCVGALLILALALALAAACQLVQGSMGAFIACSLAGLGSWIYLSTTLYYFCHGKGGDKISFLGAAIAIAWSYLPFLFTGIGECYKGFLGQYAFLSSLLPVLWFITLVFSVFKSALKISHRRLTLLAFTVPPLLLLSLGFWLFALLFFLLIACPN